MVEQAMFFLAGLLVAGLAGLLILPAFARRAGRLAEARARMSAPLSVAEVVAERDMLRGEHALERWRLEQRVSALEEAAARHRAALGRQDLAAAALQDTSEAHRAELAASQREILSLEAALGSSQVALHDFSARLERASSNLVRSANERLAAETLADEQRSIIAGLETRASGLEMKLGDAQQAAKSKVAAEQTRLLAEAVAKASEAARLTAEISKVKDELRQARERVIALEAALAGREPTLAGPELVRLLSISEQQGDQALRETITRLAAEIAWLSKALPDEAPMLIELDKRREARATLASPSQEGLKSATPGQARQLHSTAPDR